MKNLTILTDQEMKEYSGGFAFMALLFGLTLGLLIGLIEGDKAS